MSTFIRPEAKAALMRWRETIAGGLLATLGIWWIIGPGQLMAIIGGAAVVAGIALMVIGYQRARFRSSQDGIGSVEVDEGQVTYFGPLTGGAVALRDLTELALLRTSVTTHWRLSTRDAQLYIPVDAAGADALFDAILEGHSGVVFSRDTDESSWARLGNEGRVRLDLPDLLAELAVLNHPSENPASADYPFVLSAGERRDYSANTIYRHAGWRRKDPAGSLRICPDDAARRLVEGALARRSRGGHFDAIDPTVV